MKTKQKNQHDILNDKIFNAGIKRERERVKKVIDDYIAHEHKVGDENSDMIINVLINIRKEIAVKRRDL